jgi:hypothetical protein
MLRYLYLAWFSQPALDRPIYKLLRQRPIRSIVELGIGHGVRTRRLLEVAAMRRSAEPLRYAGIDLFEARDAATPGLALKQAYALLKDDKVKLQLVPGDPLSALARAANGLADTDLLLISADQQGDSLLQAWRYVPRMLHENSLVYLERPGACPGAGPGESKFELLTPLEIARLAKDAQRPLRRAA